MTKPRARKKALSVDPKSYDLAEHFLSDVPGFMPGDIDSLATAIQTTCEEFCSDLESVTTGKEP